MEQVESSLNNLTPAVRKEITTTVRETYKATYEGMVEAVEKSADIPQLEKNLAGVRAATPETIKRIVENPISGLTLNDRLEKNRQDVIYNIKQQIGIGLTQGDRYTTMARRISEQLDMDYRKAIRIVRTEAHRVREAGTYDAATEIDTILKENSELRMVKVWHTMQDERVRPQRAAYRRKAGAKARKQYTAGKRSMLKGPNHMKMDGVTVLADESFDLGGGVKAPIPGQSGVPGHDINCRCFIEYDMMTDAEYYEATGKHFVAESTEAESWAAEDVTKARKRIATRMKKDGQLNDRQLEEFNSLMSDWSDDQVMVYDKFTKTKLKKNKYHERGGAYYQPGRDYVNMDIDDNIKERHLGRSLTGAWATKFHEEFHQIDYTLFRQSAYNPRISNKSRTKAFANAFEHDIIKLANEHTSFRGKKFTSWVKNQNAVDDFTRYLVQTYSTRKAKAQLNILTDALGLATKDAFSPHKAGFWGHNHEYNQRGTQWAAMETWASYGGCIMSNNTEQREVLDKLIPNTMKLMDEWFELVVAECH